MTNHAKGLRIVTLSMLVIMPDALLIRLVETDHWTLTFWRGLLSTVGLVIGLAVIYRRSFWSYMLAPGIPGLWIGTLFGGGTAIFVWSITHTTAANTLLILSTGSMFGAAFSWLLLREPLALRTVVAIIGTSIGLFIIVDGDVGGGTIEGDLAALVLATITGLIFTLIRKHAIADMVPTLALGGLVTAGIAAAISLPVAVHGGDFGLLALMGLVMLPLAFGLQFYGARYIPAPEVSLLFLLEAVLGPLLLWIVIAEHPGTSTLIGGTIVLGTLAIHAAWGLRQVRRPSTAG